MILTKVQSGFGSILAKVVDENEDPLHGAFIYIIACGIKTESKCDNGGIADIRDVPSNTVFRVFARKKGFADSEIMQFEIATGEEKRIEIALNRGKQLSGMLAGNNKQYYLGNKIFLVRRDQIGAIFTSPNIERTVNDLPGSRVSTVQEDGSFIFTCIASAAYRLILLGKNNQTIFKKIDIKTDNTMHIYIELDNTSKINCRIQNNDLTKGCNISFSLHQEIDKILFNREFRHAVNDYKFNIDNLYEGKYIITTAFESKSNSYKLYKSTRVDIKGNETREININLEYWGEVKGRLISENTMILNGLNTVLLRLDGNIVIQTETDETNSFRFPYVPLGKYTLSISPGEDSKYFAEAIETIDIPYVGHLIIRDIHVKKYN